MSQGSVDAATIEQTKQQIRGLVQQIAQMSRSDMEAEDFYAEVLQKIVTALAAVGGAVWTITPDKRLKLDYQINIDRGLLDTQSPEAQQHLRLLQNVIQTGEAKLAAPKSGGEGPNTPGNPTNALLVLAPMQTDDSVEGVLEVFQRPDSQPQSQQGYLRFLIQMSQLVGDWLKSRKLRTFSDRQSLWAQIDRFAKEAHNSLDLGETAYTIANEGRRLIGCDRLSVTVKHGIKHKVEAVSGQDTLDTRSNIVVLLRKLTDRVCAAGEPLWYNGQPQDLPPQIENALQEYIDESHTKSLAVIPIREREVSDDPDEMGQDESITEDGTGDVIGALIVEQIDAPQSRDLLNPKVELVKHHSARALSNSLEHNNLFLMPVWRALGNAKLLVKAKTLPKTLFFSALTIGVLLAMFIPWQFRLKAAGTLEPVNRAEIFVGANGQVQELFVDHGDQVQADQTLLQLMSTDLQQQQIKIQSDIATANSQKEALRSEQRRSGYETQSQQRRSQSENSAQDILAQLAQIDTDLNAYYNQMKTLAIQESMLSVKSPINGEIVTWDAKRLLPVGRPLSPGQRVLTVADTSPEAEWELIAFLPEKDLGHFLRFHMKDDPAPSLEKLEDRNIQVSYVMLNHPGRTLEGKLIEIQRTAELIEEEGVCYRLRVKIDNKDHEEPSPGSEVITRVHCGKKPLGFVLFHDAWEWVQTNLLF